MIGVEVRCASQSLEPQISPLCAFGASVEMTCSPMACTEKAALVGPLFVCLLFQVLAARAFACVARLIVLPTFRIAI
jgi:hypothetical protein